MVEGLEGTQSMNQGLRVRGARDVFFTNTKGEKCYIRKSKQHHKLFFKLTGCNHGRQHFKYCTPRALHQAADLWCPFCMDDACQWQAAGKAPITSNELMFMLLLRWHGCSEHWCHQVRHDKWHGCFDFYNWRERVCVQVDGACHWHGMHTNSAATVRNRDFCCNHTAFNAGVGLVRVHESDLQHPHIVLAAIDVASTQQCVVFTSSYWSKAQMQVTELLQAVHTYCQVRYDAFGNLICNK